MSSGTWMDCCPGDAPWQRDLTWQTQLWGKDKTMTLCFISPIEQAAPVRLVEKEDLLPLLFTDTTVLRKENGLRSQRKLQIPQLPLWHKTKTNNTKHRLTPQFLFPVFYMVISSTSSRFSRIHPSHLRPWLAQSKSSMNIKCPPSKLLSPWREPVLHIFEQFVTWTFGSDQPARSNQSVLTIRGVKMLR